MAFMHRLPRLPVVWREDYLLAECAGKSVLHLGAVGSYHGRVCGLHQRLLQVSGHVVGLDIDIDGIEQARAQGVQNLHYGDLERLEALDLAGQFDVILAAEVIEHLPNPGLFLAGIKRFFGPATEMIVTTPDAFSLHRFLVALAGREYVHPDHVCYYSYSTLRHLLQSQGFAINRELVYLLGGKLSGLRRPLAKVNPHFASGLILVVSI